MDSAHGDEPAWLLVTRRAFGVPDLVHDDNAVAAIGAAIVGPRATPAETPDKWVERRSEAQSLVRDFVAAGVNGAWDKYLVDFDPDVNRDPRLARGEAAKALAAAPADEHNPFRARVADTLVDTVFDYVTDHPFGDPLPNSSDYNATTTPGQSPRAVVDSGNI